MNLLVSLLRQNNLILLFSLCLLVISPGLFYLVTKTDMEGGEGDQKYVYSVWAIPSESTKPRLRKVMEGLRSEFGGPEFDPHVTVVGAIRLTEADALQKFKSACEGLKPYTATVKSVSTGTFFYQCVYLLLNPTPEVMEAGLSCSNHFGYNSSTPYMPHLSLLYADLTQEEKQRAKKKAEALDENFSNLSFTISRLALHKTDTEDKTLKSWEKVSEYDLV